MSSDVMILQISGFDSSRFNCVGHHIKHLTKVSQRNKKVTLDRDKTSFCRWCRIFLADESVESLSLGNRTAAVWLLGMPAGD